jgi:hypothetical protein
MMQPGLMQQGSGDSRTGDDGAAGGSAARDECAWATTSRTEAEYIFSRGFTVTEFV